MEYENMRMPELKSLAREPRLRNAELVALLQNNPPPAPRTRPSRPTRPPPPPPPTQTSVNPHFYVTLYYNGSPYICDS